MSEEPREEIAQGWRRFAREAAGRSALYVEIAETVADAPWVLDFLASMPRAKWQPNVLLGVVRYLYGTPSGAEEFLALVAERADEIAEVMAVRSTQTNEAARCATLLPVLARLPQPLALLEVGASAGLCLLPDYYTYTYAYGGDHGGEHLLDPSASCGVEPPVLRCRAGAGTPLPERGIEVAWRAGLDLNPVDLSDEDEVRWLEALIWPGEEYRVQQLRAAASVARVVAPRVVQGDLRCDVGRLAASAPPDATLVVFHTAVLAYVSEREDREAFARSVASAGAVWVANEGPRSIPGAPDLTGQHRDPAAFLLCVDASPVAWTDGHGTWIDWLAPPAEHEREFPATRRRSGGEWRFARG